MHVALACVALIGAVASGRWIVTILRFRSTGFDVSDEAYYLVASTHPDAYAHGPTDFGRYLAPVWRAVGEDLGRFRLAGLAAVLVTAAAAGRELSAWVDVRRAPTYRRVHRALVHVAASSTVLSGLLLCYSLWLVTPGYNLMAMCLVCGVAMATIGCVRIGISRPTGDGGEPGPVSTVDLAEVSLVPFAKLGALLVVLASIKVTAAAASTVLAVTILAVSGGRWPRRRALAWTAAGAGVGLGLYLVLVGGRPWRSIVAWRRAYDMAELRVDHPARQVWESEFIRETVVPWLLVAVLLAAAGVAVLLVVRRPAARITVAIGGAIVTTVTMWASRPRGGVGAVDGAGWWWVRFAMLGFGWIAIAAPHRDRRLLLGPLVGCFALAATIGTNNGMIRQVVVVAGLLVTALVFHALIATRGAPNPWQRVPALIVVAVTVLVSWETVGGAASDPYRLGAPLSANDSSVDSVAVGVFTTTPGIAAYVEWLAGIRAVSPEEVTCVVNLEGGTPAASLFLGLDPVGGAWLLGGYPGSNASVPYALEHERCWQDRPFLLIEAPGGPRNMSRPAQLDGLCAEPFTSLDFRGDYETVMYASWCRAGA